MMRAVSAFMIAVVLLATPRPAMSAPPANADAAFDEAAQARVAEGMKLYQKKKYDRALAAFLQAYTLSHDPTLLLSMGLSALRMNDSLQAVKLFEKFLHDAPDAPEDQKERARTQLAKARRSLGRIEIAAPEGAQLSVDDAPVGRAPLAAAVDVLPGKHVVSSTFEGATKTETVNVAAMELARVRLGTATPTTPTSPRATTPAPVPVTETEPAPPPPPEAPKEAPGLFSAPESPAPAYVASVIGLTALTTAIVLHGMTVNADRNVSNGQEALARSGKDEGACATPDAAITPTCASLAEARQDSSSLSTPTLVAAGVGAGATLFALAWWMFAAKETDPAKTGVRSSPVPAVSVSAGARGGSAFDAQLRVRF
jgi:hypothetical protein